MNAAGTIVPMGKCGYAQLPETIATYELVTCIGAAIYDPSGNCWLSHSAEDLQPLQESLRRAIAAYAARDMRAVVCGGSYLMRRSDGIDERVRQRRSEARALLAESGIDERNMRVCFPRYPETASDLIVDTQGIMLRIDNKEYPLDF